MKILIFLTICFSFNLYSLDVFCDVEFDQDTIQVSSPCPGYKLDEINNKIEKNITRCPAVMTKLRLAGIIDNTINDSCVVGVLKKKEFEVRQFISKKEVQNLSL